MFLILKQPDLGRPWERGGAPHVDNTTHLNTINRRRTQGERLSMDSAKPRRNGAQYERPERCAPEPMPDWHPSAETRYGRSSFQAGFAQEFSGEAHIFRAIDTPEPELFFVSL